MSNKVLYLAVNGKVQVVPIIKETNKQYTLGTNEIYRRTLNKTEVDRFDRTHRCAFSFDEEIAVDLYNKGVQDIIDGYMNYAKKLSTELISKPITLAVD